jgi:acyl-CoA thioester hydrolase
MAERQARSRRQDYARFVRITTRWHDNDIYGHVNNVVYYAFFDTAVNQLLVEAGVLDPVLSPVIGLVVETHCSYFEPVAFPAVIEVGVRVEHLGNASVRYALGIFCDGAPEASAQGAFTHVYVTRASGASTRIPDATRTVLAALQMQGGAQ